MPLQKLPFALIAVTCVALAGCDQCSKKEEMAKPADSAAVTTADPSSAATAAMPAPATDPNPAAAPTDPATPSTDTTTAAVDAPATSAAGTKEKPIVDPTGGTTLKMTDLKVGSGPVATEGKEVSVFYTGTLLNGTKFDSTKDRGTPFSFVLGSGMVIAGWDQGVKGMKEGGLRKLIIPSNLAYGNRAVGGVIPPNSTLVFEIELLKVKEKVK